MRRNLFQVSLILFHLKMKFIDEVNIISWFEYSRLDSQAVPSTDMLLLQLTRIDKEITFF